MHDRSGSHGSSPRWRNFPTDVEALARDWARRVRTAGDWEDHGAWAESESRPRLVYSAEFGLYGVAKPGIAKEDGVARAAHEKLAADLAFELDLPVPPAVLWDRSCGGSGVHGQTVISAWAFPQPHPWTEARAVLNDQELAFAARCLSAMRVFEAWIYATDRKLENVLVSRDGGVPGAIRMACVDYSFSLTHTWKEVDEQEPPPWPYCEPEDAAAKQDAIDRIEAFGQRALARRVGRLPNAFLPPDEKRRVLCKLLQRRQHLRTLVGLGSNGTP